MPWPAAPFLRTPLLLLILLVGTCLCDDAAPDGAPGKESVPTARALVAAANASEEVVLPKVDVTSTAEEVADGAGEVARVTTTAAPSSTTTSREMARRRAAVSGGFSAGHPGEARRRSAVEVTGRGRRRHTDDYASRAQQWTRPQAHASQQIPMSQSLYDHFSPLDPELPSGDILPFLQFGMKLPPVVGGGASKSKGRQRPSPTTTTAPRTTTAFPGASTNALVEEEAEEGGVAGNEMSPHHQGHEGPASGAGATRSRNDHSSRQASKLKAAILLQMMVNNVRRKKLALGANATGLRKEERAGFGSPDREEEGKKREGEGEILVMGGVRDRVRPEDSKEGGGEGKDTVDGPGDPSGVQAEPGSSSPMKTHEEVEERDQDEGKKALEVAQEEPEEENEAEQEGDAVEQKTESVEEEVMSEAGDEWEKARDEEGEGEGVGREEEADEASAEEEQEGEPPHSKRRVVLVSRRRKKNNEYESVAPNAGNSPPPIVAGELVLNDAPLAPEMGHLRSLPHDTKKPEDMEWKLAPPVTQTPAPEKIDEVPENVTTSTTERPIPSATPIVEIPSTSSLKKPHPVSNVVQTTPFEVHLNDSVTSTSSVLPTTSARPTTVSTTRPPPKHNVTTTLSPLLSLLSTSTSRPTSGPSHPPITRHPYRPPVELSSRHPPVAQAGHPQIHPSLLAPVPHVLSPLYKSTTTRKPAQERPSTTTGAPVPDGAPNGEVQTKVEVDVRDWVAVPPPNATSRAAPSTSPPTRVSPQRPSASESLLPKPHPNGVEKGWQRPHPTPPTQPQPHIPIEHHFGPQWRPQEPPVRTPQPQPTTASTTEREVLSVVTSVSVESSPAVQPLPSTASFVPSTPAPSLETEVPTTASQYPRLVGVEAADGTLEGESEQGEEPEVLAEAGMGPTATYVLLSLAIVPGVVAVASAARCLLVHRKKNLYESETSSEVSCMGGRTLKSCSRGDHIPHTMTAEETGTIRQGSDVFRAITRLPRVAHLGWDHERRRRQGGGKGGRSGVLEGEEGPAREEQEGIDNPLKEAIEEMSSWEFPRSKLRLQTLLGQGNFGQVWKAEADGICDGEGSTRLVAVKLVKAKEGDEGDEEVTVAEDPMAQQCTLGQSTVVNSSRRPGEAMTVMEQCRRKRREEFMAELGIMQLLSPPHPNVVTLLGCCTTTEPPLLIMEYVMFGKLLTYLRDHRSKRQYCNVSDDPEILTARDLIVFAYCVVKGMEYLVSKGVVHRDLAARNILVDHNKTCKIADFGMSRCVRETGGQVYEERQKQGALPVRWMAPESLFRGIFTHKSDVWSFGVLLWEIITLGSTPYPGIGARDVMRRVRDGRRLERPSHVRPEIFRVAARCWHRDSTLRPTFSRLRADLGPLLASASSGITLGSGTGDSEMCLVPNRGNRRWRPPGPQIDLTRFEDDSY